MKNKKHLPGKSHLPLFGVGPVYGAMIIAVTAEAMSGSGYEVRFIAYGICTLMRELGLCDLVPALCRLDYTMSEESGVSDFVREYTLVFGGPYCDCGYKKRKKR